MAGSGEITALLAFDDVTELKALEAARLQLFEREKRLRAEAEQANQNKDNFLAVLSHELRTPLSSILGWTQLLLAGELDEATTKTALTSLEQNVKTQTQLIDDLLDISRIQSGKLHLNLAEIDPRSTVAAAIDSTHSLAIAKSIEVESYIEPRLTMEVDPVRLQQILWNLISNSIKFSPAGSKISVRIERVKEEEGRRAKGIRLQVRDQGKGIKPEYSQVILERFIQLDSSDTRAHGGLGLGLAIVKKLVKMHHGTIAITSAGENQGTTTTIIFPENTNLSAPARAPLTDVPTKAINVSLANIRVLLVEDDASTREVLSYILKSFSCQIYAVESVRAAFEIFHHVNPDIVISDIAMPDENGYDLIRKLRALPGRSGQIPAIALTAHAGSENSRKAIAAGFTAHIAKPVEAQQLVAIIAELVEKFKKEG